MVVNRRISVSTAPPVSRTASTQPAIRASVPLTPLPSGANNQTNGAKTKKRLPGTTVLKRKRSIALPGPFQLLLLGFSAFLVYSTAICSADFPRTMPFCKSFDLYRMRIIDPYVLPPVESIIQHAEPYVSPLKPYAASTADFTRTRITPHVFAFIDSSLSYYCAEIAPRIHWLIVDQAWNGAIKPYFDIVHPTLERHTHFFCHKYLAPGVRKGAIYANATYDRVLPHTQHYLSNAQRNASRIYKTVRLHVLNFYERIYPYIVVFLDWAHMHTLSLAQNAGDLRREFIDPHVRKMLDKVGENLDPSSVEFSASSTHNPVDPLLDDRPSGTILATP